MLSVLRPARAILLLAALCALGTADRVDSSRGSDVGEAQSSTGGSDDPTNPVPWKPKLGDRRA